MALRIAGQLLDCCFFSERTFKVKDGNSYSTQQYVLSEVPQSLALASLLFVIYTADITSQLISKCVKYTDEIKIYDNSSNYFYLAYDFQVIHKWA